MPLQWTRSASMGVNRPSKYDFIAVDVNPLLIFFRGLPPPAAGRREAGDSPVAGSIGSLRAPTSAAAADPRGNCPDGRSLSNSDGRSRAIRSRIRTGTERLSAAQPAIIDEIDRRLERTMRTSTAGWLRAGPAGSAGSRSGADRVAFLAEGAMQARIGFDHYTIAHRGFTAEATLRFARAHRFDGVQFLDAASIDESLDADGDGRLPRPGRRPGPLLEAGLPSPNPVRRSRELGRPVPPAERGRRPRPARRGPGGTGLSPRPRLHRRPPRPLPHRHALARPDRRDPRRCIRELTPRLKDRGIRLAIETHADLTVARAAGRRSSSSTPTSPGSRSTPGTSRCGWTTRWRRPGGWPRSSSRPTSRTWSWRSPRAGFAGRPGPSARASCRCPTSSPPILRARPGDRPVDRAAPADLRPADLRPPMAGVLPRPPPRRRSRPWSGSPPSASADTPTARSTAPKPIEAIPWAARDLDWLASSLGYLRSVVPTLIESACDPAATDAAPSPTPEAPPPMTIEQPASRRIVSLDQFRGYTVAGMLLVNFLGGYQVRARDPQAPQYVLQLRRHDHAPVLLRRGVRLSPHVPPPHASRTGTGAACPRPSGETPG